MLARSFWAPTRSEQCVQDVHERAMCRTCSPENEGCGGYFDAQQPLGAHIDEISFKFRNQASR
jgi:hypothetical protein